MKTVLLLGDSIRLSYQPLVAAKLAGRARVVGPSENGRFALYTLMRLDTWLGEFGTPDVVHWNNGLWDLGQCDHRHPRQIPLDDYVGNLELILQRLRATGASILWRNTTAVDAARGWRDGWRFDPEDVERYNTAASRLMRRQGIACHDLHAVVHERLDSLLAEDGVHLTQAGQEVCADSVVEQVLPPLSTDQEQRHVPAAG
ncbi:MAG: SGNH/GDSL hydrolase family protein [Kiritimatiellae bacterium]|nr:SGNH/GDSL hydrolase family protein [Kiritimatiellia bacterium]